MFHCQLLCRLPKWPRLVLCYYFATQSSSGGVTKISCADVGPYIGNSSLGNITVVDTPGFGVNIEEEEEAIEQLAA